MPEFIRTAAYPHQMDALQFAEPRQNFALFLPPGLGKTKIVIDHASRLFLAGKIDAVLYVAPNGVQRQTLEEQWPEHSAIPFVGHLFKTGTGKGHAKLLTAFLKAPREEGLKVLAVNVESFSYDTYLPLFRGYLKNFRTFMVVDEATTIANISATRTRNIINGLADVIRQGNRIVKSSHLAAYRAVLTGTPITNNPFSVWAMAEFLHPGFFGLTYSAFCARYGLQRTDHVPQSSKQFRRAISLGEMQRIRQNHARGIAPGSTCAYFNITNDDYLFLIQNPDVQMPYKNLPELKEAMRSFAFMRKKEDCLNLPAKIYTHIYAEMNDEQAAAYRDLATELVAEYGGKELTVANKISLVTRLSQVAGGFFPATDAYSSPVQIGKRNAKVDALLSDLEDVQDYPIIVLTRFVAEAKAVAEAIAKAYPDLSTELIYGEVDNEHRAEIIERFKRKEVHFLVATQKTIGIGFNLQAASLTYYYSNSYSLVDREQSEDRTHRSGQTAENVVYKDIIMRGTVDEKVYEVLRTKKDLLTYMQDVSLEEFIGRK